MKTNTKHMLLVRGRQVRAEYNYDVVLPLHRGNPLIEALPAPRTQAEVHQLFADGSPPYDPSIREAEAAIRRQMVGTMFQVFVPLRRHTGIEEAAMDSIRNSYAYRNPLVRHYMTGQVELAEGLDLAAEEEPMIGAPCIIGWSGTGKTRSLQRALVRGCPQLIQHSDYRGRTLAVQQVTWLYVSCAHDGSMKDLCCSIAHALDAILGTDYTTHVGTQRTEHAMAREIARVTALHATGLIVIDEIQHICVGRPVERRRLARFLTKLMNSMSTRIMLVGTPEAREEVARDMPLLRRTVGESGQIAWPRVDQPGEWHHFLKGIWRYQYTVAETPLDTALSETMRELTVGIPDIAVKLYSMVQRDLIGNPNHPCETITPDLLRQVMEVRMPFASAELACLHDNLRAAGRWNDPKTQLQIEFEFMKNYPKAANPIATEPEPPAEPDPIPAIPTDLAEPAEPALFDLRQLVNRWP